MNTCEGYKVFKESPTHHEIAIKRRLSHSFFPLLLQAKKWISMVSKWAKRMADTFESSLIIMHPSRACWDNEQKVLACLLALCRKGVPKAILLLLCYKKGPVFHIHAVRSGQLLDSGVSNCRVSNELTRSFLRVQSRTRDLGTCRL